MKELPKAYEPQNYEDQIYKRWEESGFFNPDNLPGSPSVPYTIALPPPNATGTLHLGHAMYTVQDILIRFERMRGKAALWVPGTDHAAIATNAKVERLLKEKEGLTRHDIGRDAFLERVHAFIKNSQGTINHQLRKMGFSLDWSREAYTLDEIRNKAVRVMFKRMYEDGLIYRGVRVVNWDPQAGSTISDDEVVHKESEAMLYTFKYSADFPIAIATTRPETKVGDTAVAVHPDDERYKKYVGQEFTMDFAGTKITVRVIADESVDPNFGTGALGVTPAHSQTDYDLSLKHKLPLVEVIDTAARMNKNAGDLVFGKTTKQARVAVADWLKENNLMISEEKIVQNISTSERTGAVVEPLPMRQWFVAVNKPFAFKQSLEHPIDGFKDGQMVALKELMQKVVRSKQISMIPDRFEKIYFYWIDNLRDWNISRQIWFGHRIPAWYRGDEVFVSDEAPEGEGWEQDPDVLDTWFSSGFWTASIFGWPEKTGDLQRFHPTDVLETGYDIIFFWVARMILMTTYAMGEIPFKTVYLHGLVRDEQGRKMSKSLDNIIDPLDVSAKYGTDAVRLALIIGSTPGNDKNLSEQKIEGFRNFTNKLWNISRFMLLQIENPVLEISPTPKTLSDSWILNALDETVAKTTKALETFQLSMAGEILRDFTWGDLADWYLEIAKIEGDKSEILNYILNSVLKLWHPFMPFVTEQIWTEIYGADEMLMVSKWPTVSGRKYDQKSLQEFEVIKNIITGVRSLRSDNKIEPVKKLNALIGAGEKVELVKANAEIIKALARLSDLEISAQAVKPATAVGLVEGGIEVFIDLAGVVDMAKEKERLQKELESLSKYIAGIEGKLNNTEFAQNAPAAVVEKEKQKLSEAQEKRDKIKSQI